MTRLLACHYCHDTPFSLCVRTCLSFHYQYRMVSFFVLARQSFLACAMACQTFVADVRLRLVRFAVLFHFQRKNTTAVVYSIIIIRVREIASGVSIAIFSENFLVAGARFPQSPSARVLPPCLCPSPITSRNTSAPPPNPAVSVPSPRRRW